MRTLIAGCCLGAAGVGLVASTAHAASDMSFAAFQVVAADPALVDDGGPSPPDFDKDGFPDVAGTNGGIGITFGGPNPGLQIVERPYIIMAAGDVNGDGFDDLLMGNSTTNVIAEVILGRGAGARGERAALDPPVEVAAGTTTTIKPRVYDVNLDGADDLVTWSEATQSTLVFLGQPSGSPFTATPLVVDIPTPLSDVVSADMNGDGFGDAVVTSGGSAATARVYQGGPEGLRRVAELVGSDGTVVLGDANGDGLLDVGTSGALWALQIADPPVEIPEAPMSWLLPISAGAVGLAGWWISDRRRATR